MADRSQRASCRSDGQGHRAAHPHPGIRYLPSSDAAPVTVHLAWNPHPAHPAAATFREHTRRVVAAAV
ncbi:LysR family transcriptional regulator [Saccharopolyspora spinosa]|uniref:LysR family transcriptional regulator n=1 Tax=Saccharopolyspora spinosa TaxID=60894 RepID=UPI0002378901|nr:LysR family transcriptional regulator [Saccharopolyspora spinosa]